MRRSLVALATAATAFLALGVPEALALHGPRHAVLTSGGFPWDTFFLWLVVGLAIALLVAWVVDVGRRRHWHLHRPAHV